MLIKTLPVGQLETNCYVVTDEESLCCVLIDPGDDSNMILNYLEDNKLNCKAIFLTHGHFDHTGAVEAIVEELNVPVYLNSRDEAREGSDRRMSFTLPGGIKNYDEGDVLEFGALRFEILATPGHTPGGVSIICQEALFTGDTLFKGNCGRVDLPGGSMEDELRSLKKLCELSGDYEVYPGHMDPSRLERERLFNYYCREAMKI